MKTNEKTAAALRVAIHNSIADTLTEQARAL